MNRTAAIIFVAGFVAAMMTVVLIAGAPFVRTGGDPQIEGNVTLYGDTTFNGNGSFVLDATGQVDIDAATTTNTNATGALYINWAGSQAATMGLKIEAQPTADVMVAGAISQMTGLSGGGTSGLAAYSSTLVGDAGDTAGASYAAYNANGFTANGGTSEAYGLVVGTSYTSAVLAQSGDVTFLDYAPTILAFRVTDGPGDNLTIQGGDGLDSGAGAQDGGDAIVHGGNAANAGTDGDVVLAYTAGAAQGNVGVGVTAPSEQLEIGGNALISNAGGSSNSYKLLLAARWATGPETQTGSLFVAFGADPYLVIAAPDAVGAETNVIHMDETSFRFATDNTTDIGKTGANRPKDIYLSGNLDAEIGSITAQTDITSDTGNIAASAGNVTANGNLVATTGSVAANTTVTAGTGITATTGNIVASAGFLSASTSVSDQYENVRRAYPQQVAAAPAEPFDCVVAVRGWIIYVDDNNDTGESCLCFCGVEDDDSTYEWLKAENPSTSCFP